MYLLIQTILVTMLTAKVHVLKCQNIYNVVCPKHCCRINRKSVCLLRFHCAYCLTLTDKQCPLLLLH